MSSVRKGLTILKIMGESPFEFRLSDLASKVGIVKSGAHKILADLTTMGFVVQNPKSKQYRLGPAVFRLGIVYSDMKGIEEVSKNVMLAISNMTGMSILVGIRDGDEAFLAYKIDSETSFSYEGKRGRKFPLYAGALGKLLGAYLPKERMLEIFEKNGMEKKTEKTVIEKAAIFAQYEEIRRDGYVLTLGENIAGAFGLAVPIFDRNGEVWSCLCIAGPYEAFKPELKSDWLRMLKQGAIEISHKLGVR